MQKANSVRSWKVKRDQSIQQQEMKQSRDPHCPSDQMLDMGQCWLNSELQVSYPVTQKPT